MKIIFSAEKIHRATIALANRLNHDYKGQQIAFLGVLKGSFVFLADLIRHVEVPCTVDFVRLSSYGAGTTTSGKVKEVLARCDPVRDRHVVVVEEIVDSGTTLARLLADLEAEQPASLKVLTLVDKTGRRETEVPVDYRGLTLVDGFLVGYGLDLDERYRNLPDIWALEDGEIPTCREETNMAIWTCPECGNDRETRCKPKKCPTCDKQVEYQKKEAAKK